MTPPVGGRPNVLLVLADDHRYGAIRALRAPAGDPVVQTPRLDGLVAQGVSFDRTYHFGGLTGGVCVPARACLMAGANPFRALASKDLGDAVGLRTIHPGMRTLPEAFRDAGYHTYHVGKWHNDAASFHRGFSGGAKIFMGGMSDHYRVPVSDFDPTGAYPQERRYAGDRHSTELFGGAAVEFLRRYARPEPFFLSLAFTAPHDPRTPPAAYAARYPPEAVPLPPNALPVHPFDNGDLRVRDEALAPWPRPPDEVRRHLADYYGMITHLDAWVGHVLDALETTGHAGDTVVVYTADHGLAVGQHGLFGKQNLYEHSARVPCILRAPGVAGGRRCPALTYTPDLHPTLCELAGVAPAPTVETRSLVPLLRGAGGAPGAPRGPRPGRASGPPPKSRERSDRLRAGWRIASDPGRGGNGGRDLVCQVYKDVQRMACDGRWKLIRYYRSGERPGAGTDGHQLFDLEADPWEMCDLSAEPALAGHTERLAAGLAAWQRAVGDPLAGVPVLPAPPLAGFPLRRPD